MRRRQAPADTGNVRGRRIKHRASRGASSSRQQHAPEPEPEPVVDLPFGYLFENNEAEHERFIRDFASRPIIKPKSLDMTFFAREGLDIVPLLGTSHLGGLAEMSCPYSEVMVRAFYHNMIYIHGDLQSRVCGVDILVTADMWTDLLGFDFDAGDRYQFDGDTNFVMEGYVRDEAVYAFRRPGGHRPIVTVGQLTVSSRILFYVITHILFPRAYNHSRVLEGDIPIMWSIRNGIEVNWRHYICWHMYKARHKGALPCAYLVQKILEKFGVPMDDEVMVKQEAWNAIFGQRLLEQCKITKGADGGWHYIGEEDVDAAAGQGPPFVPDVGQGPPIVLPEVDDDDGDDVHPEPEGGFSLSDVMQAIQHQGRMQKKRWKIENERWRWMQARMKWVEETLGQMQLGGAPNAAEGDDVADEHAEDDGNPEHAD